MANDFLMQFQADILGVPVIVQQTHETTALGAAYLAGLAVGFWKDRDEIAKKTKIRKRYLPAHAPPGAGNSVQKMEDGGGTGKGMGEVRQEKLNHTRRREILPCPAFAKGGWEDLRLYFKEAGMQGSR